MFGSLCAMGPVNAQSSSGTQVEAEDPAKFFLFHIDGGTVESATKDLGYCVKQAKPILSLRDRTGSTGGLLGGLLTERFAEIDRLRMRNAAMRKCMSALGYARYQVPSADWRALVNKGDIVLNNSGEIDPVVIHRMAVWATGPTPAGPRLDP